ncbi:hypothetical protein TCAL_04328 [Tigriopus californicus]|uniref:Uncharacterized protein n=1 Tax=Tigriopus californicus TaxID=6832 RepID=A0A553PT35_TIGCA|nr:uncharacterized protein LOC131892346 [Tigriopus californicus]TRY80838.1 hypothetical protein TCAL_04328 [Tigriopus californicus]
MPVNSTSTGATYGKSSDPLCPLGFHPQIRWPTRCKRCFRDYKEHSDSLDKQKYADCDRDDPNSWIGRRTGFQKSKSLDVTMESSRRMALLSKPSSIDEPSGENGNRSDGHPETEVATRRSDVPQPVPRSRSVQPDSLPEPTDPRQRPGPSSDNQTRYSSTPRGCDHENEISKLKARLDELNKENQRLVQAYDEASGRKDMNFEAAKANETSMELRKAKDKLREHEIAVSDLSKEKKGLLLRVRELEKAASKVTSVSERQKTIVELETKLKYIENKCKNLERENDKLTHSVQNLEGELEEVQDNFREDEADEYRNLRRELELTAKNCRVLHFKLKKTEKSLQEVTTEKDDLELTLKQGGTGGSSTMDYLGKIKRLEKELEQKSQIISRYESHVCDPRGTRKISPGLSKTSSVDRGLEEQLLKDLQDAIERENDLKEQLNIAEEENNDMRLKMSRFEDENESLLQQVKKMSVAGKPKRRSPSPAAASKFGPTVNASNAEDDVAEVKLQLELTEREAEVLRKKVENLLSENLKINKELKTAKSDLSKVSNGGDLKYSNAGQLQTELTETRMKLVQKERQLEVLESQLKYGGGKSVKRSASDEAALKRLEVVEKEAEILRQQNSALMAEKGASSARGPDQANKISALETQKRQLERKIEELEQLNKSLQREASEKTNLSREKSLATSELNKVREQLATETRKVRSLQQEKEAETAKFEKVQRDSVAFQKEKRYLEEEKSRFQSMVTLLESDQKSLKAEYHQLQLDHHSLKGKNTSNLQQTQEGMKAFKEQIDVLKKELLDEKTKNKENKKQMDEAAKKSTKEDVERLQDRIKDLEEKWAKSKRINQQRKDKIDGLEKQLEENKKCLPGDVRALRDKLHQAEKKLSDQEKKMQTSKSSSQDDSDLVQKFELMEEAYVIEKANLQSALEAEQATLAQIKQDHAVVQQELSALRHTYNTKADDWIKEKLDIQRRVRELEDSIRSSAGGGWDLERERFKQIIEDRDNQITQLKIEGDVARSQSSSLRKEADDLKFKLQDYEKMSKFQKAVSSDSDVVTELKSQLDSVKKELTKEQKDKKAEANMIRMKYDSKIALLSEEISVLKAQSSKYRRERQTYKEMMEGLQKSKATKGDTESTDRERAADMLYKMHVLEDELSEAKLETSRAKAETLSQQSKYEVDMAELKSKINEMEESALIESGRARIAGTRTKMELAWQKERDGQRKLINELSTMSRDLKATLFELEKERDRERLETKRKLETMKASFEEEQEDTRKQLTELQYDLLELRDAHAKLRTTNDKLKRDKDRFEKEKDEFKSLVKEKSRSEQGEEKKVKRLIDSLKEFLETLRKSGHLAGGSVGQLAGKLKVSLEELEQLQKMNEEERERSTSRRNGSRRAGSLDGDGSESPASRSSLKPTSQRRQLYRKTLSVSDTISENDSMWKSQDSTGSRESLGSNASIPLPVPVRTRSTGHGSESGYSSDYNNIRRIERDTSVDRLSSGSKESNRSTQSEWVGRDKRKKSGLIGKLKKLTRGLSAERSREFGSGSDISSVSVASNAPTAPRTPGGSSSGAAAQGNKSATLPRNSGSSANEPFDQYFKKASTSGLGTQRTAPATPNRESHSRVNTSSSYRR